MIWPKLIEAHREATGIIMMSISIFYVLINLLIFHGWTWIDKSYESYSWTGQLIQAEKPYWLNTLSFILFITSIIIAIIGFAIYKPGKGPIEP